MELIYKKDALHAVLHNEGQAAVAAVENIKPINPHGELREMLIDEMIDKGEWLDEQRGRWIYAKCNLCCKVQDVRSNYCPNCGAKMDGMDGLITMEQAVDDCLKSLGIRRDGKNEQQP